VIETDLYEIVDPCLRTAGTVVEEGDEYRTPPLDVLRYYCRPVRLHWFPILGRALGVVAVVRQPVDIGLSTTDYQRFLSRLAMAVNARYPPWRRRGALVIGLTCLVLTPEPIGPGDDAVLGTVLGRLPRMRAVPLAVIRVNLGQEAMSLALTSDPDNLFPEALALAEALTPRLRRFVPLLDV
jgi:hypothetical protein